MESPLIAKNAVVCGSTQGIGKAIALDFAKHGANVIIIARDQKKLETMLEELRNISKKNGIEAKHSAYTADFQNSKKVKKIAKEIIKQTPIHILVNNTGGPNPGMLKKATADQFIEAFAMHLINNHQLAQIFITSMKKEGYGRIINIISTSVKQPIPNLGVSNTTRGAVASWAKTLASEVAEYGITVNNLLPGMIQTQRLKQVLQARADKLEKPLEVVEQDAINTIPAKRFGRVEEMAAVATFLATPSASYVTGTSIPVDGGRTQAL